MKIEKLDYYGRGISRSSGKVYFIENALKDEDVSITLLKEKKSIIVNLEYVNKDIARRIVDVVSGAVHALDGNLQKVSNSIFLVAPYNYDITNEMAREEIKNKLSVSWIKNNANN